MSSTIIYRHDLTTGRWTDWKFTVWEQKQARNIKKDIRDIKALMKKYNVFVFAITDVYSTKNGTETIFGQEFPNTEEINKNFPKLKKNID